jgi:hypothetical protein
VPDEQPPTNIVAPSRYPPGRYGRRRDPAARSRLPLMLIGVAVVLASLGVTWTLYQKYGPQDYQGTVLGWTDATPDHIVITFRVDKPAGKPAVCQVRARNRAGIEVGYAEVRVTGPRSHETVTYRLPTTDLAIIGEVPRCSAA